ncbi:unnamed protein product [Prorocentrum cordatum]|uniref:Uncharacterized protein n=1 Tax=Prorocentrum cordatum TaxID=2364126 RepID=A0ABN9PE11_9DINO|nr:unnamed protein product [Polarella glacialis]
MAGGVRSPLHTRSRNSGTEQDRSEARTALSGRRWAPPHGALRTRLELSPTCACRRPCTTCRGSHPPTLSGWGERRTGGRGRGRRAGENAQDRLRPRAGRGPGRGRGEKRICREREQQQEEQEGVAAAAQQGPRRRLAAAAQKMMSSSFFVLSSALGTSRADTGAGIARPLASSSFLSAIFSRSIFAFFFSTTFLTLKNSSRSISSISCVMYWMVSSMRGIRTYCRAFTRRLVILISSSRVLKAHCNEASLIRATIDLK